MDDLQRVEFDILKEFVDICDKLGLTYYLVCGSALGAVKYNGFIPWDDDVDVALPRGDYEVFCRRAPRLLPSHLFLQNHVTDSQYPRIYSKLRNSNSTYIEKPVAHIPMNHGAFIDVFPLDGYPNNSKNVKKLERIKKWIKLQLECALNVDYGLLRNTYFAFERFLGFHKNTAGLIDKLQCELVKWSTEASELWCNHGNWQGRLEYAPREQYGEGVIVKFEGLDVRVPEKYDEYLTQKYGDWRADLPPEQQVGHHYYAVCDTTRPYTDYIERLPNGKIRIKNAKD